MGIGSLVGRCGDGQGSQCDDGTGPERERERHGTDDGLSGFLFFF